MAVGFIGLGQLGATMARRLISQGVELSVWNRTISKAHGLAASFAASPKDLVTRSSILFLNLFDSAAVEAVLTGPSGVLAGNCAGKLIVDTTTNHFKPVIEFHERLARAGGSYLEAPVLGSVVPASKGELVVLVSGARKAFENARPMIEHLGKRIFFLEQPGLATKMKLVNNLVLGSFMAILSEALVLGESAGLKRETTLDILGAGAGNSGVLNAKRQKLMESDFSPHFSAALIHKDLGYLEELARELKHPSRLAPVVRELFGETFAADRQHEDFSVLFDILKRAT